MLIVNFINTLPNMKDRNIEDFDDDSSGEISIEKNRKKRKIVNQNKCALVPKKSV